MAYTSWAAPAGDVEWSCRDTVVHMAGDVFSYASQVIAESRGNYLPIDVVIDPYATSRQILDAIAMCGRMLEPAVENAPPRSGAGTHTECRTASVSLRWGAVEVPAHTYDMANVLRLEWKPPAALCTPLLDQLSPTRPPVIPPPCFSTAAAGHPWMNTLGWRRSRGTPLSPSRTDSSRSLSAASLGVGGRGARAVVWDTEIPGRRDRLRKPKVDKRVNLWFT